METKTKTKTINVTEATWLRLMKDKLSLELKTPEDVIIYLYAKVTDFKRKQRQNGK